MEPRNSLSHIKVVGFDLDQTLYPKSPLIDEKIQEYLYQCIAEHKKVSLGEAERLFKERYRGGAGLSGRLALEDLGIPDASSLVQEALERADIAALLAPDKETEKILKEVRARYMGMDLITGSDRSQIHKKLAAIGLTSETFTHVISADEAEKSTGDAYRLWLSHYPQLQPEHFLYIGDRIFSDHEVPSALGIRTVLVYVQNVNPSVSVLQLPDFNSIRKLLL